MHKQNTRSAAGIFHNSHHVFTQISKLLLLLLVVVVVVVVVIVLYSYIVIIVSTLHDRPRYTLVVYIFIACTYIAFLTTLQPKRSM
jgi:uncharacterized membrane protein YhaH (DUF805 family)